MFDIDQLVADCHVAGREGNSVGAVREVVERAVRDPAASRAFAEDRSALDVLHRSESLTVLHVALPPHLGSMPHEHRMWAVVGVLDGQEDNAFFRRSAAAIVPSGGRELRGRDVLAMGDDTIHAIRNPRAGYLSAIHVYGGDLMGTPRSEWDSSGREERPYDEARVMQMVAMARSEEERLDRGLTGEEIDEFLAQVR